MKGLFTEFTTWLRQHWFLGSLWVLAFLALLTFIVSSIIGGVLGNAAYDWIKAQGGQISIIWWLLLLMLLVPAGLLLLVVGLFARDLRAQRDKARQESDTWTKSADLEQRNYALAIHKMRAWGLAQFTALKLMAAVKANEGILADDERDFKNLIRTFLDKAVEVFGADICRAVVLKPINGDSQLVLWEWSKNMTTELGGPYEVGDEDTEGTAGYVFRTRTMEKGKMVQEDGLWRCTARNYRFAPRRNTDPPHYMSLIAAPLEDPDHKRWGVLCLDSKNAETFDDGELIKVIQELADGLAAGISTYANFKTAAEELTKANARIEALQGELQVLRNAKE